LAVSVAKLAAVAFAAAGVDLAFETGETSALMP
jgi:hypothetical protein